MGAEALAVLPVIGAAASLIGLMGGKQQQQSAAPQASTPAAIPQASVAPDSAAFAKNNAASAAASGQGSTLLTGLAGVPNSSLNLGKNQVLGQ